MNETKNKCKKRRRRNEKEMSLYEDRQMMDNSSVIYSGDFDIKGGTYNIINTGVTNGRL